MINLVVVGTLVFPGPCRLYLRPFILSFMNNSRFRLDPNGMFQMSKSTGALLPAAEGQLSRPVGQPTQRFGRAMLGDGSACSQGRQGRQSWRVRSRSCYRKTWPFSVVIQNRGLRYEEVEAIKGLKGKNVFLLPGLERLESHKI